MGGAGSDQKLTLIDRDGKSPVAVLRPLTPMQFGLSVHLAGDRQLDTLADAALDQKIDALEGKARGFESLLERPRPEGFEISIQEPLAISNDPKWMSQIGAALVPELLKLPDLPQQIDAATWAILGRPPTAAEAEMLGAFVTGNSALSTEEIARLEQVIAGMVWALAASSELRFNH